MGMWSVEIFYFFIVEFFFFDFEIYVTQVLKINLSVEK